MILTAIDVYLTFFMALFLRCKYPGVEELRNIRITCAVSTSFTVVTTGLFGSGYHNAWGPLTKGGMLNPELTNGKCASAVPIPLHVDLLNDSLRVVVFLYCLWPQLCSAGKLIAQHKWERQQRQKARDLDLDAQGFNLDDERRSSFLPMGERVSGASEMTQHTERGEEAVVAGSPRTTEYSMRPPSSLGLRPSSQIGSPRESGTTYWGGVDEEEEIEAPAATELSRPGFLVVLYLSLWSCGHLGLTLGRFLSARHEAYGEVGDLCFCLGLSVEVLFCATFPWVVWYCITHDSNYWSVYAELAMKQADGNERRLPLSAVQALMQHVVAPGEWREGGVVGFDV